MENHPLPEHKPHVLFLFSDTGGGHRSASEAIIEALNLEFPGALTSEMVDFFKEYAPPPLDRAEKIYPPMARVPDVWELGYRLSNRPNRTRVLSTVLWPYYRRSAMRLFREHPADIIVSVHPLANIILRVLGPKRPPSITVVTDMVSTHSFWYTENVDLILVPTDVARQRGIEFGLDPEKIRVVGLPVAEHFCRPPGNRKELRRKLGWPETGPVILLVGGGEGMGPIEKTAYAIDAAGLKATLVVVAGRNRKLKNCLDAHPWSMPTFVYSFVSEMPDFMQASDMLVTKAGPGTISESLISGLPMILYSRMPGQEDGNVTYVVNKGAGEWAPEPNQVVSALRYWLKHPQSLAKVSAACKKLAKPNAANDIARTIAQLAGIA